MTIFTTVPDNVLEPGDPIRSVDIIAIKDNTIYNYETFEQTIVNTQTFDSSGTWTKPPDVNDSLHSVVALIVCAGGGGGARRSTGASGGTGGAAAFSIAIFPILDMGSTANVVVGAGGAGGSVSANGASQNGFSGGNSSIESGFLSFIGQGQGAGRVFTGSTNGGEVLNAPIEVISQGNNSVVDVQPRTIMFSGCAGRDGSSTTDIFLQPLFGGGGASGRSGTTVFTQNILGGPTNGIVGAGGNGADNGTAENGGFPGGGGGGASGNVGTVTGGTGGDGRVIVYTVRKSTNALEFFKGRL
jgi:hypothetical protein